MSESEGRGAWMNHQWNGQPSAYDARSVLLTEIEPTYPARSQEILLA